MSSIRTDKLEELHKHGLNLEKRQAYLAWVQRVEVLLPRLMDDVALWEFHNVGSSVGTGWVERLEAQAALLEAYIAQAKIESEQVAAANEVAAAHERVAAAPVIAMVERTDPKRVFVVHGHDAEVKETVARFLEKLKLEPIVLHEQPNAGQTIIEKFERHADVGFAVVLLTPDDVGGPAAAPTDRRPRARQNVILELGFFMGRLTRKRVCALYKAGVEIPSDYQGVVFVELDESGAWRTKLAQELVEAGLSIDVAALIRP